MKRRVNSTQRNYIIAGLCMILVIMGVGYAAFQSQLKISGTSNISSNFLVKITNIEVSNVVGGAQDKPDVTTHTDTTATFGVTLQSPGDSITYDITVANQGTIDAILKTITKTDTNNSAILFETSGVNEGDELKATETATMRVKVTYNPNVTSQPSDLESNLKIDLDYEQVGGEGGSTTPGGNSTTVGGQTVELVDSGDGLYEDEYESGRYIYRGSNPDNYITFNGETWRIIAKETDGTYKIIRNDVLENRAFDEANHRSTANNSYCTNPQLGCGVYAAVDGTFSSPSGLQSGTVTEDSSIKIYLNDDYYVNSINVTAKEQMTSHSFNIGAVEYLDQSGVETDSIEKNIAGEKMYTWTGNVGLANVSDILRASTNPLCTSVTTSNNGTNECNSNYLLDHGSASSLYYWTINASSIESDGFSYFAWYGIVYSSYARVSYTSARTSRPYAPRPVVFLKSDITLNGTGTQSDPFTIE